MIVLLPDISGHFFLFLLSGISEHFSLLLLPPPQGKEVKAPRCSVLRTPAPLPSYSPSYFPTTSGQRGESAALLRASHSRTAPLIRISDPLRARCALACLHAHDGRSPSPCECLGKPGIRPALAHCFHTFLISIAVSTFLSFFRSAVISSGGRLSISMVMTASPPFRSLDSLKPPMFTSG